MANATPTGTKFLSFDSKISDGSIPKYSASKGVQDMISVVSTNHILPIHTHYAEGIGSFHCFQGACCRELGQPKLHLVLPIVKYTGNSPNNYGDPIEGMYYRLGKQKFESDLKTKQVIAGDLSTKDLWVSCVDSQAEKYQNLNFELCQTEAKWRTDPKMTKYVTEFLKTYEMMIENAVAKTITPEYYAEKTGANDYFDNSASQQPRQINTPQPPALTSGSRDAVAKSDAEFDQLIDEDI